jgi:cystathionine beta-synthase
MMHENILNAIGNTPLVKIPLYPEKKIYAKLEYLNPGGSVKDRSARYMVESAEKSGLLKPGGTIIDASSGNQGIAVAMIGAIKGYPVIITVSEKISAEKLNTIKAYGAQVVVCPSTAFIDDPQSYHSQAVALHKNTPGSFMPNQYYNTKNREAHESHLGPEIWQQTNGMITHFFAGAGTTGTISGVGRYLKSKNPHIKVFAVDSAHSYRATQGNPKPYILEGIGMDFETPIFDPTVIDEILCVHDNQAIDMLKKLSRAHGLLVGPSSGAVAYAAQQYASQLNNNDCAVIICGDSGRAYLTKNFY